MVAIPPLLIAGRLAGMIYTSDEPNPKRAEAYTRLAESIGKQGIQGALAELGVTLHFSAKGVSLINDAPILLANSQAASAALSCTKKHTKRKPVDTFGFTGTQYIVSEADVATCLKLMAADVAEITPEEEAQNKAGLNMAAGLAGASLLLGAGAVALRRREKDDENEPAEPMI